MWSLNNIALENFGIIPGRADGTNLAVFGNLDMPARIGKTFHDWTGEKGIEPYVLDSEIRHGGRKIKFTGFLVAPDKDTALSMLRAFYNELNSYDSLVPFVTPWSSHQVFIKEKIASEYLQEGWIKLEMEFQEPILPVPGVLPFGTETEKAHIDGVALESLGMFLTGFKDHLNRPQIKEMQFTAYENEGYQLTPVEALDFDLEVIAWAASYAELKTNIESLHKLLASPGIRKVNIDRRLREVFNIKGFAVTDLKVLDGLAVCKINLPLMMTAVGEALELSNLIVNEDDQLVNDINQIIQVY